MARYDPTIHHRQSIRLHGYDYRQAGAYFVTICVHQRARVFGEIAGDTMSCNTYGHIVAEDWQWLAERHEFVQLDAFVVMPNHVHGIIVLAEPEGGSRTAPTKSLGRLIGAFKTVSTKHVNEWRETPGALLWQSNFYEHIIRKTLISTVCANTSQRIRHVGLRTPRIRRSLRSGGHAEVQLPSRHAIISPSEFDTPRQRYTPL